MKNIYLKRLFCVIFGFFNLFYIFGSEIGDRNIRNEQKINGVSFTENKGQIRNQYNQARTDILYSGNIGDLAFYIRNDGISYQLSKENLINDHNLINNTIYKKPDLFSDSLIETIIYRTDIFWEGVNKNYTIETDESIKGYSNYYNVPERVEPALFVKKYNGIWLRNLYNGIDLHYYGNNNALKYDYVVYAGADYKQIKVRIEGAEIEFHENGDLLLITPFGIIKEGKPIAFQNEKSLNTRWVIEGNILSFEVENYNPSEPLIIDPPVRLWGSYYGGSVDDYGPYIVTDDSDNVYLAGFTASTSNIATTGAHQTIYGGGNRDAFLTKFDKNGVIQWGTYYGGNGIDRGFSCAVDVDGNVYLTGETTSSTNIATIGAYQTSYGGGAYDAFLVKFNDQGVRQWGTYYGGNGFEASRYSTVDNSGNIYIIGETSSNNNIATTGAYQITRGGGSWDAFIVKFNNSGARQWGTYFGGNGNDIGWTCDVDGNDNVYLAGRTTSSNLDTLNSHQKSYGGNEDAFLVKFNSSGSLLWSTYYGGSGEDLGWSCITDIYNNVYLAGRTLSTNNIATNGAHQISKGGTTDAFIVKFDSNGVRQWGSYYGGNGIDYGMSCVTDKIGNLYLSGYTSSTNNISTLGVHQYTHGGGTWDAFLVKFNSIGKRQWGTFYGGNGNELLMSSATFNSRYVYIAGYTSSLNDISTTGAHQTLHGGGTYDVFIAKFEGCIDNDHIIYTSVCDSFISPSGNYIWYNSGVYIDTLVNIGGCDSIITINLSVNDNYVSDTIYVTACYKYLSPSSNHEWTTSGVYNDTILGSEGCLEIKTVILTIYNSTFSSITPIACDYFLSPSGNFVWTTSGTYQDTITNIYSCDSIITVNLTINKSYMDTIYIESCDSFLSPNDVDIWTISGIYIDSYYSDKGCDSVIVIYLTINNSTFSTINSIVCDNYLSPSGKYNWSNSGIYLDTIPTVVGCDSVIIVNLTVNSIDNTLSIIEKTFIANESNAIYQWVDCINNHSYILGETNQSFTPTSNGFYALIISKNDCIDTSECYEFSNVNIYENIARNKLLLYPNPTINEFTIDFGKVYNNFQIIITDLYGKKLYVKEYTNSQNITINLNNPSGIYFIHIISKYESSIIKLEKL